ncbi:hypothetical protein V7O66_05980 [Methanolobus sp. ZRKC3]|uniref:hypothetical protein n=1 Tax=Methanolobus sp. ZRKC3 TaxID=3125786 RepID=UPI00324EDCEF
MNANYRFPIPIELGLKNPLYFEVNNPSDLGIKNVWIRVNLPDAIRCTSPHIRIGDIGPNSSGTAHIAFIPTSTSKVDFGHFDLYFELESRKYIKEKLPLGKHEIECSYLLVDSVLAAPLKFGLELPLAINLENHFPQPLTDVQVKCFFSKGIDFDTDTFKINSLASGFVQPLNINILPKSTKISKIGYFNVNFMLDDNYCHIPRVEFEKSELILPELHIRLNIPDVFYKDMPATIGIIVENRSDELLSNVCFSSCFPSFVDCQLPKTCIAEIQLGASRYAAIDLKPNVSGKVNFGNLNISFEVNGILCQKEPIDLGTYNVA